MTEVQPLDKFYWVGTIETYSGVAADVFNLTPEMVVFEDIAKSLSNICRYNGHIPSFYSVAEHSVRVAWWVKVAGGSIMDQMTALMHDASETYVGDMVRPLKRNSDFGHPHQLLEDKVSKVLSSKYGYLYPYPEIVHEADKQIYYWEVERIRTGKQRGWSPEAAYDSFVARFEYIKRDLDATRSL